MRKLALFGKQINNDLITVETETTLISISGFVGKPETARRTYGEQFFFVNNKELTTEGRYPGASSKILRSEMDKAPLFWYGTSLQN